MPQDIGCKKDGTAQPLTLLPAKPDCIKQKTNRFQALWHSKDHWITCKTKHFVFHVYTSASQRYRTGLQKRDIIAITKYENYK